MVGIGRKSRKVGVLKVRVIYVLREIFWLVGLNVVEMLGNVRRA